MMQDILSDLLVNYLAHIKGGNFVWIWNISVVTQVLELSGHNSYRADAAFFAGCIIHLSSIK